MNLQRLLKAVTALDVATARARHAAWLQAVRPVFLSADEAAQVHIHVNVATTVPTLACS